MATPLGSWMVDRFGWGEAGWWSLRLFSTFGDAAHEVKSAVLRHINISWSLCTNRFPIQCRLEGEARFLSPSYVLNIYISLVTRVTHAIPTNNSRLLMKGAWMKWDVVDCCTGSCAVNETGSPHTSPKSGHTILETANYSWACSTVGFFATSSWSFSWAPYRCLGGNIPGLLCLHTMMLYLLLLDTIN